MLTTHAANTSEHSRPRGLWRTALLVLLMIGGHTAARASSEEPVISDRAWQQIAVLLEEKRSRTAAQKKLGSALLYAIKRQRNDPVFDRVPELAVSVDRALSDRVQVDVRAAVSDELLGRITAADGQIIETHADSDHLRVDLPLMQIESIAALASVRSIRLAIPTGTHGRTIAQQPRRAPTGNPVITEGVVAHAIDSARNDFGVDGTGVTVCAISDSVDELSALQTSGELPMNVVVLPGQSGNPGTSEGTALLEIIHDIAPAAQLMFATASVSSSQVAQNIMDLEAAGCDVIVDDFFNITEPIFQNGIVARAIEQVVAQGVVYVTAAGNFFNLDSGFTGVWEGLYSGISLPPAIPGTAGLSAHDYGGGFNVTTVTADGVGDELRFPFSLKWANPAGQSGDDYDLFLLFPGMTAVADASTAVQDGDDDALEFLLADINRVNHHIVVVKFSGNDVWFQMNTNGSLINRGTDRQIFGHNATQSTLAVGAVDVQTALPQGGVFTGGADNPPKINSSDGFRRMFFDDDGNPLDNRGNNGVDLMKPDLMAANVVSTTSSNYTTFEGASASAPHVAGMVALYLEAHPGATVAEVHQAFKSTALDIGTPGVDRTAGAGIAMMDAALMGPLEETIFSDSFEEPAP